MSTDLEQFNKIIDKLRRNLNMSLSDMLEASPVVIAAMATEYEKMGFSAGGLSKDVLRQKLGRAKAIRSLLASE